MDTEIQTFNFNSATLRTLTDTAGDPWFVLKDCMSILGLGNPTETVKMFDDDEFSTTEVIDSIGRRQQTYIISESGLYGLVLKSRKTEAKEFKTLGNPRSPPVHPQARHLRHRNHHRPDPRRPGLRHQTAHRPEKRTSQANRSRKPRQGTGTKSEGTGRLHQRIRHPTRQGCGETPLQRRHPNRRKGTARMAQLTRLDIPARRHMVGSLGTRKSRTLGHGSVKITRKGLALLHTRLGETNLANVIETAND